MARLAADDVACWVLKTAGPVALTGELTRCVRPSYRLALMAAGQPCLLWRSGRDARVHALGDLTGAVHEGDGGPVVPVRFRPLPEPVPRAAAPLQGPAASLRAVGGSGVLRPSWLDAAQYAAVLARLPLGAWGA